MKENYYEENGYLETINRAMAVVSVFPRGISQGKIKGEQRFIKLKEILEQFDAIVVGAGSGLSTSAGFTYSGKRFEKWFSDFEEKYGFHDMYSGGFMVMDLQPEIAWAYWARFIYINRYMEAPKPVYQDLLKLLEGKDYFVITTNVDHQFQKAGFDKKRLFYTQGDYGLFQSTDPDVRKTFENKEWVFEAMRAQGFIKDENGNFVFPEDGKVSMSIPSELIPAGMTMNLRSDDSFVEDEGWHRASAAYADFLRRHQGLKVLFMEIGVGNNTPVIIKYPFWAMTYENVNAVYACLNYSEAYCPKAIEDQSICIDGDTGEVLKKLLEEKEGTEDDH